MKGMTSMYSHEWKARGFIVSAIGFIGMIAERLKPFAFLKKFNADQHSALFQWIMLFGLVLVIYSKEKYEDDRAKMIRLKAFQIAFGLEQAVILAMALTGTLAKEPMTLAATDLFIFSAAGIILYLLVFHIGLYFDFLWDYEDRGVIENLKNIKKNRWGVLVYLLIAAITLLGITLFGPR